VFTNFIVLLLHVSFFLGLFFISSFLPFFHFSLILSFVVFLFSLFIFLTNFQNSSSIHSGASSVSYFGKICIFVSFTFKLERSFLMDPTLF
jgi:hypothetical protein